MPTRLPTDSAHVDHFAKNPSQLDTCRPLVRFCCRSGQQFGNYCGSGEGEGGKSTPIEWIVQTMRDILGRVSIAVLMVDDCVSIVKDNSDSCVLLFDGWHGGLMAGPG